MAMYIGAMINKHLEKSTFEDRCQKTLYI